MKEQVTRLSHSYQTALFSANKKKTDSLVTDLSNSNAKREKYNNHLDKIEN